ncbi:MAG: hypothetical protein EXR72_05620 [Myxococcales bacterium]|nr:hypothetical protein [Myxococcales bacterium]
MDEQPRVGGWTQAYCTTCKAIGEHVVVAMIEDRPAKVECETCHKQHLFRAGLPGAKVARPAATGGRVRRTTRPPPAETVDIAALVAGRPSRGYDPKLHFAVGEVVSHPSFGVGLVTLLPGPQKVEVVFPAGPKLLAHDRGLPTAPGLGRPAPRDDANAPRVSDAPPPRAK